MRRTLIPVALFLGMLVCAWALYSLVASFPAAAIPATIIGYDPGGRAVYVGQGNLLQGIFREPFEIAIFLYDDYSFVTWTTEDEHAIGGSPEMILDYLDKIGKPLPLVRAILHNHNTPQRFTPRDISTYHRLRRAGFTGRYGIYYSFSKKIIWHEEGEN